MSLAAGTRLGPYEVLSPLGAGGMGEVYRARDTRLDRTVAIKVLPSHVSDDPDLKARFEREARAISQLTHPHICTLHDVGSHDGVEYLVMELLEGQTLADRVEKGALPAEQVLRYGVEIADALDRAHRAGIVHRDLKPGNIMITKAGVKLLDFGLARVAGAKAASDLSSLPTQASQPLTAKGTVMGTFQYMAPEQLEGKEADARSDIFAFGCVLYEMATGRKAFSGASQASLVTSIMSKEPEPVSAIAPMTPPALDRVVQTCLAKDAEDRWQSAADLKNELAWIARAGSQAGAPAPVVARRKNRERLAWMLAAAAVAVAVGLATLLLRHPAPPLPPTIRFDVGALHDTSFGFSLAISPDGSQLVFEAVSAGVTKLYLRRLASPEVKELPGTEGAGFPFWSPDGTKMAFFAAGSLKKVDLATGSLQVLAPAVNGRGGSWNREGVILYAPDTTTELYRVPAEGGASSKATRFDAESKEGSHRWPVFLPDGRHFLFHVRYATAGRRGIYVGTLGSDKAARLVDADSAPVFAPPDDLLYVRQKTLVDQRFDPESLRLIGGPQAVVSDVEALGEQLPTGYVRASASGDGVLAVRSGITSSSRITWFDRGGQKAHEIGPAAEMNEPALSPDQGRVVYEKADPASRTQDLWVLDLAREIQTRLTFGPDNMTSPVWSPDGRTIAYCTSPISRKGYELDATSAAGNGGKREIFRTEANVYPDAVSPDGRTLIFELLPANSSTDLMSIPLDGSAKPTPFLATPFSEAHAQFSPDGKFMSYTSNESGNDEVYVRTFPSAENKTQVSTHGGDQAVWRADGKEIFYLSPDQHIMAVAVEKTPTGFSFGAPKALFAVHVPSFGAAFDRTGFQVSADGQRFLVNQVTGESERSPITVVLNWRSEMKK
jgi:serine/threonine protein kinase/Tol biopolymer transport system component